MPHVCAGIQYRKGNDGPVHSDLCREFGGLLSVPKDYRKLLHDSLDEYLNNLDPKGFFFVGNGVSELEEGE